MSENAETAWPPCPVCGAEADCVAECYMAGPRNALINSTVHVFTDEAGQDFLHGRDLMNMMKSYIQVTQMVGGINPMTGIICEGLVNMGGMVLAALDPECPLRIPADKVDTSVPDTIPDEWLTATTPEENDNDDC